MAMKMMYKRTAAAALAAALSLGLSAAAFAEAVPTGSLTVTGHELTGKDVFAVRIFSATATSSEQEGYLYTDYELEDAWLPFFEAAQDPGVTKAEYTAAGITLPEIPDDAAYKDAAVRYVEWLATKEGHSEAEWADFADEAQEWLYTQSFFTAGAEPAGGVQIAGSWTGLAYVAQGKEVADPEDDLPTGQAEFSALPAGYYLAFPEGGSTGGNLTGTEPQQPRGTDAMLLNIPNEDAASWNIKSTFPTVDKKVDTTGSLTGEHAEDNGSAQVGDTVTFVLASRVPDMSDYQTFYFAFQDTLGEGLAFVPGSVKVTIGSTQDEALKSYYTVTEPGQGTSDSRLTVAFENLKAVSGISEGETITVTYQAKITASAVAGAGSVVGEADNEVYLEYSNNPAGTTHGTSTPDESKVYTYQIGVHKYIGTWNGPDTAFLKDAVFVLSTSDGTPTEPYTSGAVVKLSAENGNTYRVATAEEQNTVYEFTTNETGEIVIKGLEAGTYYLHEVAAPEGYNKLKAPVEIAISVSGGTAKLDNPVYTIGDNTPNTDKDDTVPVENKQGIELPETGSIGTIGLTVAGVVLVLAGVFAPRRKKKDDRE